MNPEISALVQELDSPDAKHRAKIAQEIISYGQQALIYLETVIFAMEGRKSWEAVDLVYRIAGEGCFRILESAFYIENPLVGHKVARILEEDGSPHAIEILLASLPDTNSMNQSRIITALENLDVRSAIPALVDLLRMTDISTIRYQLIQALTKLDAIEALELILSFEDDPNHHVRERVESAKEKFMG